MIGCSLVDVIIIENYFDINELLVKFECVFG